MWTCLRICFKTYINRCVYVYVYIMYNNILIIIYCRYGVRYPRALKNGTKHDSEPLLQRVHPSKTFLIILLSVLSPSTFLWLTMHLDEHRYCSNGIRYFPQKSTNLMCSTRSSKNTPD